jgi:hypothetical protein
MLGQRPQMSLLYLTSGFLLHARSGLHGSILLIKHLRRCQALSWISLYCIKLGFSITHVLVVYLNTFQEIFINVLITRP